MKLFALPLLLVSIVASAAALNNIEQAEVAQTRLLYLMSQPGIVSVGIGGCNPLTGLEGQSDSGQFVYCIVVLSDGPQSTRRIRKTFPPMSKVDGVLVYIKTGKSVGPQPRMTGGA